MALELKDKSLYQNDISTNAGVVESSSVPAGLTGAVTSAEFSNAADLLTIPDSASLRITGDLTIEGWMYVETNTSDPTMFTKTAASPNAGYGMIVQSNESPLMFGSTDGSASWNNYTNASQLSLSTWQHWALVYVSATPAITIYRDGTSVTPLNTTGAPTTGIFASTANAIMQGSVDGNVTRYCDVRVWNTARTQTQIDNNKGAFLTGSEVGLVGNWTFQPFSRGGGFTYMSA